MVMNPRSKQWSKLEKTDDAGKPTGDNTYSRRLN
jgi:hypothetical protein